MGVLSLNSTKLDATNCLITEAPSLWFQSSKRHVTTVCHGAVRWESLGTRLRHVSDAKSAAATILLLKTYQKRFSWYHLPCSFSILINNLLFCLSRRIVKRYVKKYPFLPCLEKCYCHCCWNSRLIVSKKMRGYPNCSLWIPIAVAKIYFLRVVLVWHKTFVF